MEESSNNNTMEKIAEYISIILRSHGNEILSDLQIIWNLEKFGVTDHMLIKRTLTMMIQKGMAILDHTETWSCCNDAGVRYWTTHRFFRAKGSIEKPHDTVQKRLDSYPNSIDSTDYQREHSQ